MVKGKTKGEWWSSPCACVCKNVLRCSGDKPFCCASSRCSPPQRRALPRRVAPFYVTREEAPRLYSLCFWYTTTSPRSQAVSPLLSLWIEAIGPPPPRTLTTSLPSLCSSERLLLRASWSCSQKTLHATRCWRDVRRRGGNKGRWVVPVPLSSAVGKSVITTSGAYK